MGPDFNGLWAYHTRVQPICYCRMLLISVFLHSLCFCNYDFICDIIHISARGFIKTYLDNEGVLHPPPSGPSPTQLRRSRSLEEQRTLLNHSILYKNFNLTGREAVNNTDTM